MATLTPNRSCPAQETTDLLTVVNQLAAAMNALLAKLDADAGVTDANYAATIGTIDTIDAQ
jgi:hypothetical protein